MTEPAMVALPGGADAGGGQGLGGSGDGVDFGTLSLAIVRLGRAHRALAAQLMREVGLRPDQGALMMHLWSAGPVRQAALATAFGKDSAATTRTVQRLEQAGFLRRRPDPADGRATLVEPTTAGHALRVRVEELWDRLEHVVSDSLSAQDYAAAIGMVRRLGDIVLSELGSDPTRSLQDV